MTEQPVGLRQLLAERDFRRLWLAQIVSDTGDSLAFVTLLFLVQRLTGSVVALAGLGIALAVPSLLFGVLSGVFVDRWDRRKVMIVSDGVRGVVVLGFIFVQSVDLIWLVYVLAFAHAAIGTLFDPAKSALLPGLVGKDNLLAANSLSQTSEIIFSLVGTALGGVMAASFMNLGPVFIIDAATFFTSAYLISRIAYREPADAGGDAESSGVWAEMIDGFGVITGSRQLIGVLMAAAVAMLGLGAVNVLMVPLIVDELAVSESWFGLIQGSQVLGMVIAGIVMAVVATKVQASSLIVVGLIVVGVMIAAVARISSVWQLMIILLVVGLAVVPVGAAAGTLVQTLVPDELRGRVSASMETATSAATVISMGFAGLLAAGVGTRNVFAVSGAITVVAGLVAWFVLGPSTEEHSREDPSMADPITDLIVDAARRAGAYLANDDAGLTAPTAGAVAALEGFSTALPEVGTDPSEVLAVLDELGSPATMRSTGGRYFGFVNGGTEPAGLAASILSAAWDQNVALPVMSPVAAHLDEIAARWVVTLLGLPGSATATFCGGASVANITCVLAARDTLLHRAGWNVDQRGLVGSPPLKVIVGAEAHISVTKALRVAGLGQDQVAVVPTDNCGRMIASEMPPLDSLTLLLLQAGNVNTGHSDPFNDIIPQAHVAEAWVHIDGAFGLWAAAEPRRSHLVAGSELADSWATDAHKWLNSPYDSGLAIVARNDDLRRAMAVDAAYLPTGSDRALMHLGLQMSQRARGIETWAIIASLGSSGVAEIIDRTCQLCDRLVDTLRDAGVDVLAPVVINQALVSFGDDQTTASVIAAVQRDGTIWAGGTTWQGQQAMRLSISSTSSTEHDMDVASEAILRCWNAVR